MSRGAAWRDLSAGVGSVRCNVLFRFAAALAVSLRLRRPASVVGARPKPLSVSVALGERSRLLSFPSFQSARETVRKGSDVDFLILVAVLQVPEVLVVVPLDVEITVGR